jgi:CubicO group peptidase (beta-lactamase class C family)
MSLQVKFDRAFGPVQQAVAAGRIPGAVLGIIDKDGTRVTRALGQAQKEPRERPMSEGTWFDLASLTKVLFTTPTILRLAEEGRLDLDAPLTSAIPDFAQYNPDNWQRKITFRQCLGHQTPFPGVFPLYTYGTDPNQLRHFVLQRDWPAGPAVYSDINFILLGIAIERLAGQTIRHIDPGPGFAWSADPAQAAATELDAWRGRMIVGEVHDENCAALEGSGHAGLFGTVASVLDFA